MSQGRKLGKGTREKKALLKVLAYQLIIHKSIVTTVPKAKELRSFLEKILTKSKDDSTSSRRDAFRTIHNKKAIKELFNVIAKVISERHGGYLRITRIPERNGDNAKMCVISFVDNFESVNTNESIKESK